jgi:NAD(P)-dependent dehydrogenase (short-subunit alcohol dehydrogenase family)
LQLEGLTAVITGGGSGIGRSLALAAAKRGAQVAIVDIDQGSADNVASEIATHGGLAVGYGCDVSQFDSVVELAQRIQADFLNINLLFNNAGVYVNGPLDKIKPSDAAWLLAVNVLGVVHVTQAFLPALRAASRSGQRAVIVNTGSENSFGVPVAGPHTVYTSTKHAVLGLSDALRKDLEGGGITVSVLCPGVVVTDLFDSRRHRPADFGGPKTIKPEHAKIAREQMQRHGQLPERCAELCFEGLARGDFLIITDPTIRDFYVKRHQEVLAALDRIDAASASYVEPSATTSQPE